MSFPIFLQTKASAWNLLGNSYSFLTNRFSKEQDSTLLSQPNYPCASVLFHFCQYFSTLEKKNNDKRCRITAKRKCWLSWDKVEAEMNAAIRWKHTAPNHFLLKWSEVIFAHCTFAFIFHYEQKTYQLGVFCRLRLKRWTGIQYKYIYTIRFAFPCWFRLAKFMIWKLVALG